MEALSVRPNIWRSALSDCFFVEPCEYRWPTALTQHRVQTVVVLLKSTAHRAANQVVTLGSEFHAQTTHGTYYKWRAYVVNKITLKKTKSSFGEVGGVSDSHRSRQPKRMCRADRYDFAPMRMPATLSRHTTHACLLGPLALLCGFKVNRR